MVKNKDRFRALPIKERAALINKYVSGGVMDLAEMKRHYNSFDEGGDTNSTESILRPLMSKEEYLNEQRKAVIESSLEKSKSRKMPTIPYIPRESEKEWYDRITRAISDFEGVIKNGKNELDEQALNLYEQSLSALKQELSNGYGDVRLYAGDSCIYTATDNYGKKYRISGNQSFRANPAKYGFTEIGLNELAPGDIVQDFSSRDNMPHHALTFVGYDENGKALFNYSKGGSTEEDIVINGHYPFEWDDENPRVHLDGVNNDKLKHSAAAYRFVGTKEDNEKWNNDYYDYRRSYDKDWFEEAKRVINILPTTLLAPPPPIITSKTIKANGGRLKNLSIYRKLDGKSSNNQTVSGNKAQTGYSVQLGLPKEEQINVPMYTYWDGYTSLDVPLEEAERAFGFYRDVMPLEAIPSAEELQNIASKKTILSDIKDNWKDHVNDDDVKSLFGIISDDTQNFISNFGQFNSYIKGGFDVSDTIDITAPNTDISKFIFGNKISKDAIEEISRVAKLRNQDPYDILAHMLMEGSGSEPLRTHSYYNTHDVVQRQINPSLYNNYIAPDTILKQLGIYNGKKIPNIDIIKKAYEKVKTKRNEAIQNLKVPESSIDAVALRMLLHGRDFNPAQKGLKGVWTEGTVKNTYLDMIDSAIKSLKENMPDLFK